MSQRTHILDHSMPHLLYTCLLGVGLTLLRGGECQQSGRPVPAALVINEIMYAPSAPEPEWVELLNASDSAVDLRGWSIADRSAAIGRPLSLVSFSIPPCAYLVLTRDSSTLRDARPATPGLVVQVAGFPALNNTGDAVVLRNSRGITADSVCYAPDWGGATGRALERKDPLGISTLRENWSECIDASGSTPGGPNSVMLLDHDLAVSLPDTLRLHTRELCVLPVTIVNVGRQPSLPERLLLFDDEDHDAAWTSSEQCAEMALTLPLPPGDSIAVPVRWERCAAGTHAILCSLLAEGDKRPLNNRKRLTVHVPFPGATLQINEIMYEPLTGDAEYIELTNTGAVPVDLAGWEINDGFPEAGAFHAFAARDPAPSIAPAGFHVISSDSAIFRRFPHLLSGSGIIVSVVGSSRLRLRNDGDRITLRDPSGMPGDSVHYAPSWHNPSVLDRAGRALEKIAPTLPATCASHWSTCVDPVGGTPGRTNTMYVAGPIGSTRLAAAPNPFSPDGDGRDDVTRIRYETTGPVTLVRLSLYDIVGRPIRRLLDNAPGVSQGETVWDGRDDQGHIARIGIYIIVLECLDERGGTTSGAKGTVVLAGPL